MGSSLHITFIMIELAARAKGGYQCRISLICPPKAKQQSNALCKLMLLMVDHQSQKSKVEESRFFPPEGSPVNVQLE